MKNFKIYAGHRNPVNVYGCSPDRDPDCVQPENPVGYMGMHRNYDEITWCEICKLIEKYYGCTCDDLAIGDTIEAMLVPSYTEIESVALSARNFQPGFLVDIGVDDGWNDLAPYEGTAFRSTFPDDECSTTELVGVAAMEGEMAGPDKYTHVFRGDPTAPVYVGSKAGKVVITINALPDPGAKLTCGQKGPNFSLRVNYRNHMECCHSADCPCPDACK